MDQSNKSISRKFTSDAKNPAFSQIMAGSNNEACNSVLSEQMAVEGPRLAILKKWILAALAWIALSMGYYKAAAQNGPPEQAKTPSVQNLLGSRTIFYYDEMPHFPGDEKAFQLFISKNLHYKNHQGKVFASFTVEKDGTVTNPKILRGLDTATDQEVLRVLILSPKWIPAKLKGEPIKFSYTIPITISANNSSRLYL